MCHACLGAARNTCLIGIALRSPVQTAPSDSSRRQSFVRGNLGTFCLLHLFLDFDTGDFGTYFCHRHSRPGPFGTRFLLALPWASRIRELKSREESRITTLPLAQCLRKSFTGPALQLNLPRPPQIGGGIPTVMFRRVQRRLGGGIGGNGGAGFGAG